MWTTRREPYGSMWGEMGRLQNEMNRLFESFGWNGGRGTAAVAYPPLNVWEEGDAVYAEAELPGAELSDLEIYVSRGNQLTVKGERKPPQIEQGTWHRQERGFGTFSRVVPLPADVDAEKVVAEFANGVLTVKMPKSERAKPRKIAVKS